MKEKWMARIKEHYDHSLRYVLNENQVFGVFLVGSQNYGLATSDSDVDTRVITLPSVNEIATNTKPVSKQVIFEDEHLTLIRTRISSFPKLLQKFPSFLISPADSLRPLKQGSTIWWYVAAAFPVSALL